MGDYFSWVAATCLILAFAVVGLGGYWDCQRQIARELTATEMGCKYIGSARDLKRVAFYDCNGSIVTKADK